MTGSAGTNTEQFTGRENGVTGLYFYRARYYSPTYQRFIAQDPINFAGGDTNLYGYAGNDPVDATDPAGEWGWWGAVIGGAFGFASGYADAQSQGAGAGSALSAGGVGFALGAFAGGFGPDPLTRAGLAVVSNLIGQLISHQPDPCDGFISSINWGSAIGSGVGGLVAGGVSNLIGSTADPVAAPFFALAKSSVGTGWIMGWSTIGGALYKLVFGPEQPQPPVLGSNQNIGTIVFP